MGGSDSKQVSPSRTPGTPLPPPKKETDKPWREPSKWDEQLEKKIKEDIKALNPTKKANILLLGHIGAGKSSFINSVLSISRARRYELAHCGAAGRSWTTDLKRYSDKNLLKMFYLLDTMGIEENEEQGFHPEEGVPLINGHVKRGYTFNPRSPIKDGDAKYRPKPTLRHQIHCVVFVVDAKTIHSGIPTDLRKKILVLQDKLRKVDIPRILILTKADTLCEIVEQDISKLFKSVKVYEAVKIASEVFNIAIASIHPVKNYETDFNINAMANIPLLFPLKQAMEYAIDRLDYVLEVDVSSEESESDTNI